MNSQPAAEVRVSVYPAGDDRAADRALLPRAVAEMLWVDVTTVSVTRTCPDCGGDHGRPEVRVRGAHAWASLSRGGSLVAVAVSTAGPVGVDLAAVATVGSHPLDAFGIEELGAIRNSPDGAGLMTRLWTAKEAILKADGRGLRCDPRDLELRGGPAGSTVLVGWPDSRVDVSRVHLHAFEPSDGIVATVSAFADSRPRFRVARGTVRTGAGEPSSTPSAG